MKILQTNLNYVLGLGLCLGIMGLAAGIVSGTWGGVPLGLLIAGVALFGLGLLLLGTSSNAKGFPQRFWQRRSTQAGTNAFVSILAVLAILGLINYLGARYTTRLDLSENQFFTLAPQTQQVLRNLKQPVKVVVFDHQPQPLTRTLLEQYQRQGQRFSFQLIDPQAQPNLAQKYKVRNSGDAFLESGDRTQRLEQISESSLTAALEKATTQPAKIYVLQGHGERALEASAAGQGSLDQAINALKEKNFTSEPLNLLQQPQKLQDAAVVLIAAPARALFPAEVRRLQDYLNRGGSLLLLVEPQTNPGLEPLLKDWGVQLDNRLVIDASGQGQQVGLGPAVPLVNQYGEHPITQDFRGGTSFYPTAQAIQTQQKSNEQVSQLLMTGNQSWAEGNPQSEALEFNAGRDRQGPLALGVALSRSTNQGQKSRESRMVVIGDVDFATGNLFEQQLNGDVFLNSVTWLSNRDNQTLSIRPKEQTNRRINLTPQQSRLITLIAFGLPLVAFGTAAALWWRRR